MKIPGIPGSFYTRNGRWYWHGRLSEQGEYVTRPLIPRGGRFATKDQDTAAMVAKEMIAEAKRQEGGDEFTTDGTLAAMVDLFQDHIRNTYPDNANRVNILSACDLFKKYAGATLAEDFGPRHFLAYRDYLTKVKRQKRLKNGTIRTYDCPRFCRKTVNQYLGIIKRCFRWAAQLEIVPVSIFQGVQVVENIRPGQARETRPVLSVHPDHVEATLRHVTATVAAMVHLQMLSGMRSSEVCTMRPIDIATDGEVWFYRPQHHKTQHLGKQRAIALGKRAQEVLRPFLARGVEEFCFQPIDANKERCGNAGRAVRDRYDHVTYRTAIQRGITKARAAGEAVPDWTPHQLRHLAATRARKEMGIEHARALLGHSGLKVTEIYAEADANLAAEVAKRIG